MTIRAEALFLGSEIYRGASYGAWHPLAIPRVSTVIDLARALGWLPPERFRTSPRAKAAALTAWHTPRYIAALEAAEAAQQVDDAIRARHGLGTTANPVFPEMFRRPATAAGGSILAGELLADPGVVFNPGGGTHHGMPDRANGFCYLNDAALAILSLRRAGARRVAYVDIDAHHCDGVEHGFAKDTDVTLVSVHEERRWPFTGALTDRGAGRVWNLPVPRGFNDTEFTAVLDDLILPVVAEARPDAIVLQCGADAVEEDPLSRLALSNRSHVRAAVALRALAPRLLVLGGGGYNPWSVARAWTAVWGALSGQEAPDRLPPEAAQVMAALPWPRKPGFVPPAPWVTTLLDPPREGPIRDEVRGRIAALRARAAAWA
ncbi:acetoin utilization protein AcuC [Palleronia sp. KMU-117]|uniref:acetoin utilization protein AcuC n=1 Tax=Palleronia sp. KMU-117 TaxID=3434108 RepID=UPI003D711701